MLLYFVTPYQNSAAVHYNQSCQYFGISSFKIKGSDIFQVVTVALYFGCNRTPHQLKSHYTGNSCKECMQCDKNIWQSLQLINTFFFQRDDITNCFTFYVIFRCLELSLLKSFCLFTFGNFWNLLEKEGKFEFDIEACNTITHTETVERMHFS